MAEHKRLYNISTKIISLEDIYKGYYFPVQGQDRPEQIKYFIKNAIETWGINYVLLVGGSRHLPVRYIHNFAKYPGYEVLEPPYISDLYFADIYDKNGNFSNWDSNDNGVYGEWIGDVAEDRYIDLRPDVCIGRLPCKNRFEVKVMVNKIINYELKTNGSYWFKNMISVAGDTYPKNDDLYEGEADAKESIKVMKDFNHVKFFTSDGSLGKTGAFNIIKSINEGCGFLYLAGHGVPQFWATHMPNDKKITCKFSVQHMRFLSNANMLPVCISSGCRNSAFDTRLINLFKHPAESFYWGDCIRNCWMWALTKNMLGGCIASIGATGIGHIKWDSDLDGKADAWSYLSKQFFYEYAINGISILGEIWRNVILKYLDIYHINWDSPSLSCSSCDSKYSVINARSVQQFILLGDPTLKIGGYKNIGVK